MIATAQVAAYIKKELGTYFSTEAHPDIYRHINSAQNYIYNYRDWQFLRKTAIVTYDTPGIAISIPFNIKTHYVKSVDQTDLDIINEEEWFMGHEGVCISGDQFKARGAGVYYILYTPSYTPVDAGSATIDLPENFIDTVQAIAVHFAKKDIREYDTANQILAFAKAMMDSITERSTNVRPQKKLRTSSRHNIF